MGSFDWTAKTRRLMSAWFPYRDRESWDDLAPNADVVGSISLFGEAPDPDFMARCRDADIPALKLVGGEAGAFDTPVHARATIEGYLRECERPGYDGIDLDFEHVDAQYRDGYSALMRDLSGELHARGKRMSICVGGHALTQYPQPPDWLFYDPQVIAETCDEVRVMCYDMYVAHRSRFGPTSTAPWARECMRFWLKHVPRENLIMGLPAYSNEYGLAPGAGFGQQRGTDSPADLPGGRDAERLWLEYEKIHLYSYQDEEDHPHHYFASDAASTTAHLQTVEDLDIPGISFWHYGTMSAGIWWAVREWLG